MKKLNEPSLKVGDIILTTTTAAVSKAIRVATKSDISHAMIYVQDHSVIDATAEGVQARNTQRLFFEDDCSVYVLRLQNDLPADHVKAVCNYVRAQVGTEYTTKEAIRTAIGCARQWTRRQFCSRLVAQAYTSVGVTLVENPNFCSPADLKDSSQLIEIRNAIRPVTAEETAHWQGLDDIPQLTRDAINTILKGARKKDKDIQNFDDLHRHLAAHPEDDKYFCDLLDTSGYLAIWRLEKEKNPWQYDISLMPASSEAEPSIEEYCWNVLSGEEDGPNRYIVNRGGYALFSRQFGLRFFHTMLELYDHLVTLHIIRPALRSRRGGSKPTICSNLPKRRFSGPTRRSGSRPLIPGILRRRHTQEPSSRLPATRMSARSAETILLRITVLPNHIVLQPASTRFGCATAAC